MKKAKSEIMPLVILGACSIFFAALIAQAADGAISTNTTITPTPVPKVSTTSKFYRNVDGTISSLYAGGFGLRLATKQSMAIRLTKQTLIYQGNDVSSATTLKVGAMVKVRGKILSSTSLEATAVKVVKTLSATPEISK